MSSKTSMNNIMADLQYNIEEFFDEFHEDTITGEKLLELITNCVDEAKQNVDDL